MNTNNISVKYSGFNVKSLLQCFVPTDAEDLQAAVADYQKSLSLNPNDEEVYFQLAKTYQQQNNLQAAISACRQGLSIINPYYAQALAAKQATITTVDVPVTPPMPQGEIQVGSYKFPVIPPVSVEKATRPFWSVVIPAYKRTDYLLECLISVLSQWSGADEMEILVIDDASTPPLYELVNGIGVGVVKYYRNPQNLRQQGTWNAGVTLSRGLWIHLLHDDDYVLPGFYNRLKQSLETVPDSVGAAFTGYENVNEKGEFLACQQLYGDKRGIAENFIQKIGVANPLNPPAVVTRRETYEHLGGYHRELTSTLDWEFYKRVTTFCDWWYEPEILVNYREHSQSMRSELALSGARAASIRLSIEISESYFPVDIWAEISAEARSRNFIYCLADTEVPLKAGYSAGAFRIIQEALKIDRSPESLEYLFTWLRQDRMAPLWNEIALHLASLPVNDCVPTN